jgi:uncharacterized protein YjbI with pentapeptide repeats
MDSDQPARPVRPSPTSYLSAPLLWFNWICQWIAYLASNLAIFTVLDYGGKLAILVTVIWWFVEYPERQREAIRTAWSVVNAKGGGRMENLKYLAERHVDLKGLYAAGGYFSGIALKRQELQGSDLGDANFEGAHLEGAHLEGSDLSGTHFEGAHLNGTQFQNARLYPNAPIFDSASDIGGANFSNIVVANAKEYLAFASALNWKQAAFNEGVKEFIECGVGANNDLSVCKLSIPNLTCGGDQVDDQRCVDAVIQNIWCEVRHTFSDIREAYPSGTFLDSWFVEVTLTLTSEEQSAAGDTKITRVQRINEHFPISTLNRKRCSEAALPNGPGILQSDLKLSASLFSVIGSALVSSIDVSQSKGVAAVNAIQHEVKFVILPSGSPGSRQNVMRPASNNLNSSFISPSRAATQDLLITLVPKSPG